MSHLCNVGLAFCTPIPHVSGPAGPRLAPITVEWYRAERSLQLPTNCNRIQVIKDGMEVGEARQACIEDLMAMEPEHRPEFVWFHDFDVIPAFDAVTKLLYRARHFPDYDIFAGVYCLKSPVPEPLIYKDWGKGPYWDWSVGDLLAEGITGVHMGATLIRMSLFERLDYKKTPAFLTVNEQFYRDNAVHTNRGTEDLFFCKRAIEEAGAKILVDTSVLCGHQDFKTGIVFGLPKDSRPVLGAKWLDRDSEEYKNQKKALDLGAGPERRTWDGYRTYTTDIRPGIGVDYVQDTRCLNLPDEHFDLVASSHHLEHIPRWEQEEVWKQIFRITKPGGKIEHIVPSLDWVGAMLAEGVCDEHVLNCLYGAQELHGYRRELNLHYMGFTAAVIQALAQAAGFVDVECEDWRSSESNGYNLICRGRKPEPAAAPPAMEPAEPEAVPAATAA